ncbi:Tetratricopeptide repeat protein [Tsuneonella dongtanensis]|uniref:Tetratricopeptide repeat protein n=1 Tax=Tsuneonella dongtanensis TaxID=692370 RepID=A0A1B2AA26_9SPHN|nr:tetratricopeptide repeat protein [Tsuneonella dongtanensis]ANY18905.1 Tetratricopeptide repeat protein [Tsuneonella dongtanensis]
MIATLALLPLALMQVGPAPTTSPITAVPPELQNRPPRNGVRTAPMLDRDANRPAIELCLDTARTEPARARSFAAEWVSRTAGLQRATGHHCLGVAAGNLGDWSAAADAFLAAREEATDPQFRARMGALAGSALLSQGKTGEALNILDAARDEATGDAFLGGSVAQDRAAALVALDRLPEASDALAEARRLVPDDPHAWLLSATLARRLNQLDAAQAHIERAAVLDPRDPAIGLEAGVIAALGGRTDAARRSFESVVATAPESPQAATARTYLGQLGE